MMSLERESIVKFLKPLDNQNYINIMFNNKQCILLSGMRTQNSISIPFLKGGKITKVYVQRKCVCVLVQCVT